MTGTSFSDGDYPLKDDPKPAKLEKKTEALSPSKSFKSVLKEITKSSEKTTELTTTFQKSQEELSNQFSEKADSAIDNGASQEGNDGRPESQLQSSGKEAVASETSKTMETEAFIATLKESIEIPYFALSLIFDRLQNSVLQLFQSKGASNTKLLIFKTEMGDSEKLRIELKEKDGKWILKLGATEDLRLLIRDSLPALTTLLKEKGYDCEDVLLESYQEEGDSASDGHQEETDQGPPNAEEEAELKQ